MNAKSAAQELKKLNLHMQRLLDAYYTEEIGADQLADSFLRLEEKIDDTLQLARSIIIQQEIELNHLKEEAR